MFKISDEVLRAFLGHVCEVWICEPDGPFHIARTGKLVAYGGTSDPEIVLAPYPDDPMRDQIRVPRSMVADIREAPPELIRSTLRPIIEAKKSRPTNPVGIDDGVVQRARALSEASAATVDPMLLPITRAEFVAVFRRAGREMEHNQSGRIHFGLTFEKAWRIALDVALDEFEEGRTE